MALDIPGSRLHNQLLSQTEFTKPSQVVAWLGAVQSQDYAGAKWAVAQRTKGLTDAAVEQAFTNGEILRTHVMRPTWHFVTPGDIRWMLPLTAPRVRAAMAYMNRQIGLDSAAFKKSNTVLTKALQGNKQLTRSELAKSLTKLASRSMVCAWVISWQGQNWMGSFAAAPGEANNIPTHY